MPAQLMIASGAPLRALCWWSRRATTSLPTPVSPVMSTLASARAALAIFLIQLPAGGAAADEPDLVLTNDPHGASTRFGGEWVPGRKGKPAFTSYKRYRPDLSVIRW